MVVFIRLEVPLKLDRFWAKRLPSGVRVGCSHQRVLAGPPTTRLRAELRFAGVYYRGQGVHDRVLPPRERGSFRAPIPAAPSYSVDRKLNQNSALLDSLKRW